MDSSKFVRIAYFLAPGTCEDINTLILGDVAITGLKRVSIAIAEDRALRLMNSVEAKLFRKLGDALSAVGDYSALQYLEDCQDNAAEHDEAIALAARQMRKKTPDMTK
ncbi:hypothetical protein TWF718_009738 [Orbilia javanica]|uniref:Uncharacterized protein n=1 Tax=Orbilia javanica TaxID=47235 RepID=A0AAN8MMZ2_9PEZI